MNIADIKQMIASYAKLHQDHDLNNAIFVINPKTYYEFLANIDIGNKFTYPIYEEQILYKISVDGKLCGIPFKLDSRSAGIYLMNVEDYLKGVEE